MNRNHYTFKFLIIILSIIFFNYVGFSFTITNNLGHNLTYFQVDDFITPSVVTFPTQMANGGFNNEFNSPNWIYYSSSEDDALFFSEDSTFNPLLISSSNYRIITTESLGFPDWLISPENRCAINNVEIIHSTEDFIVSRVNVNFNPVASPSPAFFPFLFHNHTQSLEGNYFMKTLVFLEATNLDTGKILYLRPQNLDGFYTYNKTNYNAPTGTTLNMIFNFSGYSYIVGEINNSEKFPFIRVRPNIAGIPPKKAYFDLTDLKRKCREGETDYCGNYDYMIHAIPIDGKCDFNNDGNVSLLSVEFSTMASGMEDFEIRPDEATQIDGEFMTTDNTIGDYDIGTHGPFVTNIYKFDIDGKQKVIFPGSTFINTSDNKVYYVKENGIRVPIPDFAFGEDKNITIIKNGNVSTIPIEFSQIALHAPKIRKFHSHLEAQNYIKNSYLLMKELNITKQIDYNNATNKTYFKIHINKIASGKKNFTLYQVFSKREASSVNKINFIDDGDMERFVVDADPVIGWHIEDPDENETIIYETNGTGEGGTIIITQEPVIFNDGDLIVNYREIACNASNGEVALFQLDDLEDSPVFSMSNGNHFYKVCLSYINSSKAILSDTVGNLKLDIFNHTEGGNVSFTSTLDNNIEVFATNLTGTMFWDLKIQETNPAGDYSCIGSINNNYSSTFGDCAYNPQNRVWIHLGPDSNPPTTTLDYPYLSHTVKITLNSQDNVGGSGIKELSYRIDGSPWVRTSASSISFALTCPNDWGCTRRIDFYAEDNDGNVEIVKTQNINLIDVGSSCQDDCTVRPSPNRYIAECRNLNSCKYYAYDQNGIFDDGEYVAQQCHYHTKGTYVSFNSSHEIKCPIGPIRKKQFTDFLSHISANDCDFLIKVPFPAILNGQSVVMNIVNCFNDYYY